MATLHAQASAMPVRFCARTSRSTLSVDCDHRQAGKRGAHETELTASLAGFSTGTAASAAERRYSGVGDVVVDGSDGRISRPVTRDTVADRIVDGVARQVPGKVTDLPG